MMRPGPGSWCIPAVLSRDWLLHSLPPSCLRLVSASLAFHAPTDLAYSAVTIGMLNILIAQLTITYDKLSLEKEGYAMKHR